MEKEPRTRSGGILVLFRWRNEISLIFSSPGFGAAVSVIITVRIFIVDRNLPPSSTLPADGCMINITNPIRDNTITKRVSLERSSFTCVILQFPKTSSTGGETNEATYADVEGS